MLAGWIKIQHTLKHKPSKSKNELKIKCQCSLISEKRAYIQLIDQSSNWCLVKLDWVRHQCHWPTQLWFILYWTKHKSLNQQQTEMTSELMITSALWVWGASVFKLLFKTISSILLNVETLIKVYVMDFSLYCFCSVSLWASLSFKENESLALHLPLTEL